MSNITHGLSRHPYYPRWNSMNQRCYNPEHKSFRHFGGCGIEVHWDWRADNPHGFENFAIWLEEEKLRKQALFAVNPKLAFEVARKDIALPYSASNCEIREQGEQAQNRRHIELSAEAVAQLRRRKRLNPQWSLSQMVQETGLSAPTLSRMLRGVLWASANRLEPPIKTLGKGRCGIAEESPVQ